MFSTAHTQPKGWSCDYGYRPGNVWYYFSWDEPNRLRSQTVVYDSLDVDGNYWVHLENVSTWGSISYSWMRIDSACHFDSFSHPSDGYFRRMFMAHAKIGDRWTVDSTAWSLSHARISQASARSKEVVYFAHSDEHGDFHEGTMIYVEGLGIFHYFGHSGPIEELAGYIIDGKRHGNTSAVRDNRADTEAERFAVYPVPATTNAMVQFAARETRTATLTIHDMLGRMIHHRLLEELNDGVNTAHLDVRELTAGTYMISLAIDGKRHITPFVVVR